MSGSDFGDIRPVLDYFRKCRRLHSQAQVAPWVSESVSGCYIVIATEWLLFMMEFGFEEPADSILKSRQCFYQD
jgi:hypothetical protein